jgi:hypothetical protein
MEFLTKRFYAFYANIANNYNTRDNIAANVIIVKKSTILALGI